MKFFYMVMVNCKKYFKDYKNILLMFILPIACVFFVTKVFDSDDKAVSSVKIGIVNLDKGSLAKEVVSSFNGINVYDNREMALQSLKKYDVVAVYEIPDNFTSLTEKGQKSNINIYKIEQGNTTNLFEFQLNEKINKLVEVNILKNQKLISDAKEINKNFINIDYKTEKGMMNSEDFMPIVLIMFFIISFSSSISKDLLTLRKEKILERFSSTSNNGYAIIGSIYVSMIITQTIMYISSFLVMKFALGVKFGNFGFLVLNVALMSMIAISLAVMINRVFKEPGVATLVITLSSLIMFFTYIYGTLEATSNKYPKILGLLSKCTPFYWSLDSVEKSILFPNVFVLILMGLMFFTAGSIRYTNFAKES